MSRKHGVLKGMALFLGGAAVGRLVHIDRQRQSHRRTWEDHNLSTLTKRGDDSFLIVALGDSSTQGIGSDRVEGGYVPRLAAHLEEHLGRPVDLLNLATAGATIETVLVHQLPALKTLPDADLVVLNIGGNDVGVSALTPSIFRLHARRLGQALPKGSLVGNIPSFSFLPQDSRAACLSEILDEEMTRAGHHTVDLRGLTSSFGHVEYLLRYHAADLFLPIFRAYRDLGDLFFARWLQTRQEEPRADHPDNVVFRMRSLHCDLALSQLEADME